MKKFVNYLMLVLIFASLFTFKSSAVENNINLSIECKDSEIHRGDNTLVSICATADAEYNISTFRMKIHFDNRKMSFKGIYPKGVLSPNEFKTHTSDGCLTIIYLTNDHGFYLDPEQSVNIFDVKFAISDSAPIGKSVLSAETDGVCNYEAEEIYSGNLNDISFAICERIDPDCTLLFLEPSEGSLRPDFDPYIYDYELDVPHNTKIVDLNAEPRNENCNVKINRRTLNSAGSSTIIKITVSDKTSRNKLIYTVKVNRSPKIYTDDKNNSSSSNKSSNKNSSKSSAKAKPKSSKNYNYDKRDKNHDKYSDDKLNSDKHPNSDGTISSSAKPHTSESDDLSSPERTIMLKENQFNVFLAGVCSLSIIILIAYLIFNRVNSKNKNSKDNPTDNK